MKKIKIVTILILGSIIVGCVSTKSKITQIAPKVEKIKQPPIPKLSESDKQRILAKKLKSILKNKNMDNISIKPTKTTYRVGEELAFEIDTVDKSGYIYIFALEDDKTIILYPNKTSPLSELSGKHKFPNDFINGKIKMVKNCKECDNEKSLVYVLLTKEPIPLREVFSKAILVIDEAETKHSDIAVAKVEFMVR